MAINVYTGTMGSGKSYEITLNVVLPAVLAGRRVVTNIAGIDEARILEYLRSKNPEHQGNFGAIAHIEDNQISQPGFFPDESKPEITSVVRPGDLVVIDESWRHWTVSQKLSFEHMQFFRMHRHYVHPDSGVSCDLALVFQSVGDIPRNLLAVVEMNFRTTKLKTLGLNSSYRIEFWEGGKQTKSAFVGLRVTRFNEKIFPLYKSYSGAGGTEVAIDSRQNVLKNPRLWAGAVVLLLIFAYAAWFLWSFFHPTGTGPAPLPSSASQASNISSVVAGPTPAKSTTSTTGRRIGGVVSFPSGRFVLVVDRQGRFSFDSTRSYVGRGIFLAGDHEGERITTSPFPQ
jgi:zona occludens toxin